MGLADFFRKKPAAKPAPFYKGSGGTMPKGKLAQDPHARLEQIPKAHVDEALTKKGGLWIQVQSSMVEAVRYDAVNYYLFVKWVPSEGSQSDNGFYQYVSHEEFRDFMRASSKGGWVHDHLVGRSHKRGGPSKKPYTPL